MARGTVQPICIRDQSTVSRVDSRILTTTHATHSRYPVIKSRVLYFRVDLLCSREKGEQQPGTLDQYDERLS